MTQASRNSRGVANVESNVKTTSWCLLVFVLAAPQLFAQDWTKRFEETDEALAIAQKMADEHADLLASDLVLRYNVRKACYALMRSTESNAIDIATSALAEAERLRRERAQPSKNLDAALLNAQQLLELVKANPSAGKSQVVATAQRNVLRFLDLQAIEEATEAKLILDRLRLIMNRVADAEGKIISEQYTARRTEEALDPAQN